MGGEKIDVITWSEDPKEFIAAALSPSKVVGVSINEIEQSAKIVVPDHQLSLAIGKEGQNARLSAKLTGWRIDIKSETQARETNFLEEDVRKEDVEEMSETTENMDETETSTEILAEDMQQAESQTDNNAEEVENTEAVKETEETEETENVEEAEEAEEAGEPEEVTTQEDTENEQQV